ncbi:MAG: hypothetical protein ACE3JP_16855 [Ectobacillus sp.]
MRNGMYQPYHKLPPQHIQIPECKCDRVDHKSATFCTEITIPPDLEITKHTCPQIIFNLGGLQHKGEPCLILNPVIKNPCLGERDLMCGPIAVKKVRLTGCIPVRIGLSNLRSCRKEKRKAAICKKDKICVDITAAFSCEECALQRVACFISEIKNFHFARCGKDEEGNQIVKVFGVLEFFCCKL